MIVALAGHVDHGKSALVTALTGKPMQRLPEERRRGMTIELGFAPLVTATGETIGLVDVPGHADFVETMVTGAWAADAALLAIAADDGFSAQSREHLAILESLGIPRGVVAITKADLAAPEWLALVQTEVAEWLSRSPIAFGAPVPTSARTGAGIATLRERLGLLAAHGATGSRDDLFRLHVDRVFSVPGAGTVVTGTVASGAVSVGQELRAYPGDRSARVRTIQSFDHDALDAVAGTRAALALSGMAASELARGHILVSSRAGWTSSIALDTEVWLDDAARYGRRRRVRLLHGTSRHNAWLRVVSQAADLGSPHRARLTIPGGIVCRGGDRFVLRTGSPETSVGGGRVLDPAPPIRGRPAPAIGDPSPTGRLEALVRRRRQGLSVDAVPVVLGCEPGEAARIIASAGLQQVDTYLVHPEQSAALQGQLITALASHHDRHPDVAGLSVETLRRTVVAPGWFVEAALQDLLAVGTLVRDRALVRLTSFRPTLTLSHPDVQDLLIRVRQAGFRGFDVSSLTADVNAAHPVAALHLAERAGEVVELTAGKWVAAAVLAEFAAIVQAVGQDGPFQVADVREATGLSRKYLIPLLEWSDRVGVTKRDGETQRFLREPTRAGLGSS